MFLGTVPEVAYTDPWTTPLDRRIDRLERGRAKVAYYYPHCDSSTFRYRVYNMIQALEAHDPDVAAVYFTGSEIDALTELAARLDALVLCRIRYTDQVAHLIARARSRDRPVLYDIDDLIFDIDHVPDFLHAIDDDVRDERVWDARFAQVARHGAVLRLCSGAIATNDYLARHVADVGDLDCRVLPNFLNREQLALSDRIADVKRASGHARDGAVTIGYFSGSPTHERDFAVVADALFALMSRRPEVRLRLVGHIPDVTAWDGLADRIEKLPMQDFLNLQRTIGTVEINLAPLQESRFSHCKSELKYFEAAAVGTVTVATPAPAFRQAIRHGENGFLAGGASWADVLECAVGALPAYPVLAGNARRAARARYAWHGQGPAIRRAILG